MRALAIALIMCSCAPVVARPTAPASLPLLRIDPTLEGAVLSRTAAETVAIKRIQYQAWCEQRVTDCTTTQAILRHRLDEATARVARHVWWSTYGPGLLGGSVAISFLAGVAITWAIVAGALR
jgi:hypothetical protein